MPPFFNYFIGIRLGGKKDHTPVLTNSFTSSCICPHIFSSSFLVPVIHTKDKQGNTIDKIACSQYWKGKDSYRQLQDKFYSYMTENGFDLERGNTKDNPHIPIETLKQITNYENIKYELANEQIKSISTKDTNLILQQNKELVQYTNKLKLQLSKTYPLINKAKQLQKENTYLKTENVKLKAENNRLKNYLDKTFEVVKHLFNFPTKLLKNIVEDFITHIEK